MDNHKIKERQQQRYQKAQLRRSKQKRRRRILLITALSVLLLAGILLLVLLLRKDSPTPDQPPSTPPTASADEETVIHLAFAGDVNVTNKVVEAGYTPAGYDYSDIFQDILPALADADNTVVNFEGNLCGPPYGSVDTKAPMELAQALSRSGVDMLQIANSYSINNGMIGLEQTLSGVRQAGMEPLGAYASPEEAENSGGFTLRSIHGVKVAFVAFTKGMDNMSLPIGKETCVNVLYEDYTSTYQTVNTEGITQVLERVAAAQPDVTVALLHWGSEYNSQVSDSQKKIVTLMQENGVDAIIGTHSHYVQEIDYDPQTGALVAYSLGDLLGDGDKSRTGYSIVLNLEVTKNQTTGAARVTDFSYTPVYIYNQENEDGDLSTRLVRIPSAIAEYEANGITKVSEEAYQDMISAQSRLNKLLESSNAS